MICYRMHMFDTCITSLPRQTALDLAYYQMLIDFPFKAYAPFLSIETTEDGLEYYARITGLRTLPPQLVYNFVIATRTPVEWEFYWFKKFSLLARAGVQPMLAFSLSQHLVPDDIESDPLTWKFTGLDGSDWHFWNDPTNDWLRLINGTPIITEGQKYGAPCNVIWGKKDYLFWDMLENKTVQWISDHLGQTIDPQPNFPQYEGDTYGHD